MNNIVIDVNPLVHGSRAIRRCTGCIVNELLTQKGFNYNFICFSKKSRKKNILPMLPNGAKKKIVPLPYRILVPCWKNFSWPKIETIISNCDILYTNEFYFPPTKHALVLATIHGLAYKVIPDKITPKLVESLIKGLHYILKHTDYLVAVSETTKKELINYVGVPANRIYVVTHGVDKQFRKNENVHEVRNNLKKQYCIIRPYILYVGAIGIHKNIMGILAAYKKLFKNNDIDLVLVGSQDSAWEAAKQFIDDNNMFYRVHLLGHVHKTKNLVDLYSGASLFVFPSFYEGWTSPPLEAMACGTPVITSNCSSLPETVGDAAIKVDPKNTEELAYQIEKILSDKSLQNILIERGLAHVKSHTWEKAATKMMQIFTDIQMKGHWKERRI